MNDRSDDIRGQLEREKLRRRQAEAQLETARNQIAFIKAELRLREQEVRYQLGDCLVRAARPSLDTLKLPFRLARLLVRGLRQQRQRKLTADLSPRADAGQPRVLNAPRIPRAAAPVFDPHPLVTEPYAVVPPALRRRSDVCVAAVTDEFSWWAWQFEADVYGITPNSWYELLNERPPDLLLIESAWRGWADTWNYQLRELGQHPELIARYALPDIVAWCRRRGVPTVFYNKEDPPNFEVFIDAAKLLDHVFTSDVNCVPAYRQRLGHTRVHALPFAAQPRLNNPVLYAPRSGAVCFAGTWYQHRHGQRQHGAQAILRPALDYDLHIYDRMAYSADRNYDWPEEYRRALRGGVPYAQMLSAYKAYKVFLNINSVTDSSTMFSRRVVELLACGTPVISSYSRGIDELLGADLVLMSRDAATTRRHLEHLLGDDDARERLALRGQRKVFAEHTYTQRLQQILDMIGMGKPPVARPSMTMLAAVASLEELHSAWQNFARQNQESRRLVLCTLDDSVAARARELRGNDARVDVIGAVGRGWSHALVAALARIPRGFVVAVWPEHYYGPHYLTDYTHATLYNGESGVGKAARYEVAADGVRVVDAGHEYQVTDRVAPATLCVEVDTLRRIAADLSDVARPVDWWVAVAERLGRVYASDRFNYAAASAGGPSGEALAADSRVSASVVV